MGLLRLIAIAVIFLIVVAVVVSLLHLTWAIFNVAVALVVIAALVVAVSALGRGRPLG